ncbi:MAG: phage terminase large subunit [Planctomycetota bacterium]
MTLDPDIVNNSVKQVRRRLGSESAEKFASVYLQQHFVLPGSPMHSELFESLHSATQERSARLAVAAPRGHAKSTVVSLAYVLWSVLYGHERFVILASATKEQAAQLLRHIKDEIESNPLIHSDFHEAVPGSGKTRSAPWTGTRLRLPTGAEVWAVGSGQQIRGIRNRDQRPSLVVVDDLEMPELVLSEDQRAKTRDWFDKTLLKVGGPVTNVIVVGTVLHYDSLLAGLLETDRSPGWTAKRFRALISESDNTKLWDRWEQIYSGTEEHEEKTGSQAARLFYAANEAEMLEGAAALWPEREPVLDLMEIRVREGRASFDSEKQNEPLDPEHCLFKPDSFSYWDNEYPDAYARALDAKKNGRIVAAIDPSLGRDPRKADFSAIVILAECKRTKRLDVLVADIERRSPQATIEQMVRFAQLYEIQSIGVEVNGFQQLFYDQLKDQLKHVNSKARLEEIKNTSNKQQRISCLEPLVSQGKIRFSKRHTRLAEQLRQFPLGAHDDGPDALEMAVRIKQRSEPRIIFAYTRPRNTMYFDI